MIVAQLVRASDCGSEGRGFETRLSPLSEKTLSYCNMVIVAQLVRASDCGSEGRGFETRLSPLSKGFISKDMDPFFCAYMNIARTFFVAKVWQLL